MSKQVRTGEHTNYHKESRFSLKTYNRIHTFFTITVAAAVFCAALFTPFAIIGYDRGLIPYALIFALYAAPSLWFVFYESLHYSKPYITSVPTEDYLAATTRLRAYWQTEPHLLQLMSSTLERLATRPKTVTALVQTVTNVNTSKTNIVPLGPIFADRTATQRNTI